MIRTVSGNGSGCARNTLISAYPPAAATSTRARSWKRTVLPSLITRRSAPSVSITSPNGAKLRPVSGTGVMWRATARLLLHRRAEQPQPRHARRRE